MEERLPTDRDRYLIHSPFPASSPKELQDAWRSMERCLERGLARKIGVSNFSIRNMETILEIASVKPAVNQIEMHPYLLQPDLYAFLQEKGIPLQGFASLTPLKTEAAEKTPTICKRIASQYGVSEQAVLLRWVLDQGASVITTSSKRERLAGVLEQVPSFCLTAEEIDEITQSGAGKKVRGFFAEEFDADERQT